MPTTPNFSQPAIFSEVATPTVPDSGYLKVYANSGTLCSITNGGSEKTYAAISGSGLPIGAYTLPTTDGTSSQVLQTNGSGTVTWQTVSGGGGGGITSINGNSTAAQLLTVGTSGTDFAIDSVTTAGTSVFNIPSASATARGLITTGTQTIAGAKTFTSGIFLTDGIIKTGAASGERLYLTDNAGNHAMQFRRSGVTWYQYDGGGYLLFYGSTYSGAGVNINQAVTCLGLLEIRDSTTSKTFHLYNTYTSGTSYERLNIKGKASANFEIGPENGSAGGTLRGLTIGGYTAGSTTITPWLTFDNTGAMTATAATLYGPSVWTIAADVASGSATLNLTTGRSGNGSGTQNLNLYVNATKVFAANQFGTDVNGFASNGLSLQTGSVSRLVLSATGNAAFTSSAVASGSQTAFTFTGAAHTNQTASTEATAVNWNLAQTVQFATGAITTQRAMRIQAPTYGFVGASTISSAATLAISGPPVAGTNATITQSYALWVESGKTWLNGIVYFGNYTSFNAGTETWTLEANSSMSWGTRSMAPGSDWVFTGPTSFSYRNGTSAVSSRIFTTYTSATSYERLNIKGVASANFEIGPENGSAGGTLRGLTLGGYSAGTTTIAPWLSFTNAGVASFSGSSVTLGGTSAVYVTAYSGGSGGIAGYYAGALRGTIAFAYTDGNSILIKPEGSGAVYLGNGGSADSQIVVGGGFGLNTTVRTFKIRTTNRSEVGGYTGAGNHLIVTAGDPSGTDFAGGSITVAGGRGTGTGAGGSVILQVAPAGSTGSSLNALVDAVVITSSGNTTFSQQVATTGSPTAFTLTGGAHTTLALSTEATDVNFNLARTVQFATGALTTQRAMRIQAPTYGFVGASTITTASTVSISGAPVAGTNATITNAYALNVESGNVNLGGSLVIGGLTIANGTGGSGACSITATTSTSTEPYLMGYPWHFAWVDAVPKVTIDAANSLGIKLASNMYLGFGATTNSRTGTADTLLYRDGAGILAQRNSTNAQTFRVYGTYTSGTSLELLQARGVASANFEFGPMKGSAGGTLRGLTIGGYATESAAITPWLTFTNAGAVGIGTTTPDANLEVVGNDGIFGTRYITAASSDFSIAMRKSRGTESSPTTVVNGDNLGSFLFAGYDGTAFRYTAAVEALVDGVVGTNDLPTKLVFSVTPDGSATRAVALTISSAGAATFNSGTVVIPSGGTGLLCQQTNIYLDSYGTHSGIRYRRSEGTQGSPTGVAFNSLVGFVGTYGYHTGSAYHTTKGASIDFYATEAYTSGAQGTKIVFGTTPNGTTTNTVALTIDQNQVATFSKLVAQSAAEITSTPSGTTQTITLNNGNHQTLTLTSSTGAVTATLTVPSNVSSGTIIVKQHGTTPRNITWAVSAGTIKWMGTQPTWSSDAVNDIRIVSWRYDGSVMYLMSTDKAA